MKIILVLVALYLANFATSYYLHKKYVQALKRVRKYGGVSTSRLRGGLRKKGQIVLLAFDDENEVITYGERFQGLTVFSKFTEIEGIKGLTLDEMENKFYAEEAIVQAVQYIKERDKEEKNDSTESLNVEVKDTINV